jgi:hypothetical protein
MFIFDGPSKYIFNSGYFITVSAARPEFFNTPKKVPKIFKAHHQFFKDFIIKNE